MGIKATTYMFRVVDITTGYTLGAHESVSERGAKSMAARKYGVEYRYLTAIRMVITPAEWAAIPEAPEAPETAPIDANGWTYTGPADMTCGTCGAVWNSKEVPTPAGRCPFEYDHEEIEPEELVYWDIYTEAEFRDGTFAPTAAEALEGAVERFGQGAYVIPTQYVVSNPDGV